MKITKSNINIDSSNSDYHQSIIQIKKELDKNQDKIEVLQYIIENESTTNQKKQLIIEFNQLIKVNRQKIASIQAISKLQNQCKN